MKNTIYTSLVLITLFLAQSCTQKPELPFKRPKFVTSPMDTAYSQIRPDTQSFTLKHDEAKLITTKGGTKLTIPANGFVDHKGNAVKGEIELEVTEAFKLEDFITSGLTTTSDGKLLLSGGMMNINATANGSDLELAPGSEISVVMPLMGQDDYQIFTGDLSENSINWELDSTALEQDYLIPVPMELLYMDSFLMWGEIGAWLSNHLKNDGVSLDNKQYENSLLATTEFRDRVGFIYEMVYLMSFVDNERYYFNNSTWNYREFKPNMTAIILYLENKDKPIQAVDSLVVTSVKQHLDNRNSDFERLYDKSMNNKYHYGFLYWYFNHDTIHPWESWKNLFVAKLDTILTELPGKGKVKVIDDYGVDLNSPTAFTELAAKGVSSREIEDILSYNIKLEAIIEKLRRQKQAIEERQKLLETYETTSFAINKLGWINCDRFYDDPNAAPAEILVNNTGQELEFIDYSLVIPNLNVRLSSFVWDDGQYAFTKKEGPYTKLPIGADAVIVGVSIKDGKVFYSSKKIKVEDKIKLDMNMQPIPVAALSDSLASCLSS